MSRPPDVSVLLPFYQAAATLPAALASLQRQTLRDWQCVLVDDGSTDLGSTLAREAVRTDPRFELLSLPHAGLVASLNAGLARCTAPLVARMDADDLMHRSRLALQLAALADDEGLAGIGCHVRIFPRRALSDGLREYERWLGSIDSEDGVRREAFVESPLVHPTLVLRRQILAEAGYRDAGWPEDYDLLLRLLARGCRLGVLPRRLLSWRDSPERLTRTGDAYRLERHTACKASFLAEGLLQTRGDYILWGHGSTGGALRRALKKHGKRAAFVVELHPRRLGQRIEGAPVVRPEEIPTLPRLPLVASVAGAGPRGEIRAFLAAHGFVDGRDFVCAA